MGFTTLIFSNAMFFEERKIVSERDKEGLVMYENVRRRDEPAAEDSFYIDESSIAVLPCTSESD